MTIQEIMDEGMQHKLAIEQQPTFVIVNLDERESMRVEEQYLTHDVEHLVEQE
ncbi:unnamed protein product [Prunus brigantina]